MLVRLDRLRSDADPTLASELDGVPDEVEQHLADPAGIAGERPMQVAVHEAPQLDPLTACLFGQQCNNSVHHGVQVERNDLGFELAGLDLGEVQDVVDGAQQRLRRALHGLQVGALLGGHARAQCHLSEPQDADHRRADLVADRRHQARLELRRLQRPVARLGEGGFGPLSLGAVPDDPAEEPSAPCLPAGDGELQGELRPVAP